MRGVEIARGHGSSGTYTNRIACKITERLVFACLFALNRDNLPELLEANGGCINVQPASLWLAYTLEKSTADGHPQNEVAGVLVVQSICSLAFALHMSEPGDWLHEIVEREGAVLRAKKARHANGDLKNAPREPEERLLMIGHFQRAHSPMFFTPEDHHQDGGPYRITKESFVSQTAGLRLLA